MSNSRHASSVFHNILQWFTCLVYACTFYIYDYRCTNLIPFELYTCWFLENFYNHFRKSFLCLFFHCCTPWNDNLLRQPMKYFSGCSYLHIFWNIYQRVHIHSLQTLIYSICTLHTSQIFPYYSLQWQNLEIFQESSRMESCIQIYYVKSCIQFYYNNIRTIWLNSLFIFLGHFLSMEQTIYSFTKLEEFK